MGESTRVRFLATLVNGYPFSSDDFSNDLRENDIPLARIRDIKNPAFTTFIDRNKVPEEVVIQNGDLVIGMDGDFNSKIWDKGPAALNQRMCLLRSLDSKTLRFISYAIPDQLEFINELTYSTTVKHLSSEQVLGLPLPDLDLKQRHAIADYLDRETAEIDGMRADLDEMERLLTERRAAVIDTTITASETTHTVRVGYIAELITGLTYSPQDIVEDGGTVVLRSGNIQSSKINLEDEVQVRLSIPDKLRVRSGDILVCARNGSAKLVGKSAKLTSEEQGFTWGAFMTVVRSDFNEWLFWYLHSSEFEHMRGDFSSSTINQLTNGTFSRIPVPVEKDPCRRNELTEELARETAEIDSMLEDITKLRDLLAERRAAVISAAVTGQMDIPASLDDKDEPHA